MFKSITSPTDSQQRPVLEVERIVRLDWSDDRTKTGETQRFPYITSAIAALVSTQQSANDADEWEETYQTRGLLVN
jgi:hypothetical protein